MKSTPAGIFLISHLMKKALRLTLPPHQYKLIPE